MALHDTVFFPTPVAGFFGIALVVLLFTFTQADFEFDAVIFPIHRQGHNGVAFAVNRDIDFENFIAVQQ